jgi:hypothetical protein
MRTARQVSIIFMAIVVMSLGLALPAQAGTEGAFVAKINASRAAAGLPALSTHSDLVPDARAHSAEMMAAGQIYHTTNLGSVASGWEALGENVGAGPSVDSLHNAFMGSSGHRANILGDFNYVGVGTVEQDGVIWVTVIFMRKDPAPPTTTTTSTTAAPPTTTTTTAVPLPTMSGTEPPVASPVPAEETVTTAPPPPTEPPTPAATAASPAPSRSGRGATASHAAVAMHPFAQAPHRPFAD